MRKRKNRLDNYIIKKVLFLINIFYFDNSEFSFYFIYLEKAKIS